MDTYFGGLVLNQNYQDKLADLSALLEKELVFDKEISFDEAWCEPEEDYCHIYFTEKGTLIFLNLKTADKTYLCDKCDTLSYFIIDTQAPSHFFNYTKAGMLTRSEYVIDGVSPKPTIYQMITPQENIEDISDNFIFNTIKDFIGFDLNEINPQATCYRYQLYKLKKKAWWKFW